ncbi:glycolipid 2-alpha-mannosyltransferase [Scheffersomyces coipomensis]|uniref:glycolipid 2-alpha-mannosyltransferase n=1 Tax=Scheffersomyces coipomensis TaxID=1788519 RepID=UPI00315D0AF6
MTMRNVFNRRFRRITVIIISGTIFLFIIVILFASRKPLSSQDSDLTMGFKSFADNFDFSYLKNLKPISDSTPQPPPQSLLESESGTGTKGITEEEEEDTYETKGYQIKRQDVKFKYINPNGKKGTKQEVQAQHDELYNKVLTKEIHEPKDFNIESIRPPSPDMLSKYKHANATIVALVRNHEFGAIGRTIRKFEKSFNEKFNYPYTLINDVPFSDKFKDRIQAFTKSPVEFVTIPEELWSKPDSIDVEKQTTEMNIMAEHNVAYAKMESYHNMCRFYSGNMFNLPELQKYKYYWRIEPHVEFYTSINYDIFKYLEGTKKVYGFTISLYDISETVKTLWTETLKFLNTGDNYKYINKNGAFQWLLSDTQLPENNQIAGGYSTCHFWSNFEIVDMDFLRSEAYTAWFNHLDSTGKFYYERWGDAPVHSMGLALFADKSKVHWFRDVGYFHDPYYNCPKTSHTRGCEPGQFSKWDHLNDQNCMASWIDYSIDDLDAIY